MSILNIEQSRGWNNNLMSSMNFGLGIGEYITLGQMIKVLNILESGGQVKQFLAEEDVFVNGEPENRRGRKLRADDIVQLSTIGTWKMIPVSKK